MPYELFLALRYLYSRRRRPMARVTALVAVVGIACGVGVLIVALALSNGFRDEMRAKILRGTAHLTLMRRDGGAMTEWQALAGRVLSVEGVRSVAATTYDGALLGGEGASAYAVIRGLDVNSAKALGEVRAALTEGSLEPLMGDARRADEVARGSQGNSTNRAPGESQAETRGAADPLEPDFESFAAAPSEAALPQAVIGAELAARLGLTVGEVAEVISGEGQLTPLGLAPRYRRLKVAGIFRTGLYEYDATWVYVALPVAASFAGAQADSASVLSIEVEDIYAVSEAGARVRALLGAEYTTVDWQEANRPLFAALALERRMGLVIIGLIVFIATLNITATLVLVVVERRTDIAILRAMGARSRSIMLIFMTEGAAIGLIGAFLGVALGLAACFIGDRYRLVSLPADVYSIGNVPFHPRAGDAALAALVAFLLSLLATVYPARAAARIRPAEALRDD